MLAGLLHDTFIDVHDQQDQVDAADTGEHVVDEFLVTGNVDDPGHAAIGQLEGCEAEINGYPSFLLFFQAVGVDTGELVDQDRLTVVNVTGRADDVVAS